MMNESSVEIRSPRWLKVLMGIFAVPCFCVAILCFLSPFVPFFADGPPNWLAAFALGAAYFVFGAFIYWPIAKFSVRADANGVTYHTGFKCKAVRWDEVASYYSEQSQQPGGRFHLIFLDAQHKILLQIPTGNQSMDQRAVARWSQLTQFVDAQLAGKKVEAPFVSYEPAAIAARSLEVDWKSKTLTWKIARVCGLVAYALFWFGLMALLAYFNINSQMPAGVMMALMFLIMYLGPLLPYLIWIKIKQRKIAREWETRDQIES